MSDRLDIGAWVGIIALVLAVPVGVMSHVLGHRFLLYIEKQKLVRGDRTRQQAVRTYKRIKAFRDGKKDRYAFYLALIGWAIIFTIVSATCTIVLVIINPEIFSSAPGPLPLSAILLMVAIAFAVFALILMASLFETSRQLARFDDYKADLERQWGQIDEE